MNEAIYSKETNELKQLDRIEKILLKHHQRSILPDMVYSIQLFVLMVGMTFIFLLLFILSKSQLAFWYMSFYLLFSIPMMFVGFVLDVYTFYNFRKKLKIIDEGFAKKGKRKR
jgi:hypothetical protein